jgi:uracil-DNA glycosylase
MNPWKLDYWQSGEYQVVREKLDEEEHLGFVVNPERKSLFKALAAIPMERVRVAIIGQDPYPDSRMATGFAFSIPSDVPSREFPPTLGNIFDEYERDLHYPRPTNGDLSKWVAQGVLLWNAIPSCRKGSSLSHDWPGREWDYLTREIVRRLSVQSIVFVFLGSVAQRFASDIEEDSGSEVIITSHPSPRGSLKAKHPFKGSRIFTTINDKLCSLGMTPIDWRLDDAAGESNLPRTDVVGGRILPNITGEALGGLKGKASPNLYVPNNGV